MDEPADDPRPVLRCIVAWWPQKKGTPVVEPRGDTRTPEGKRDVQHATIPLHEAADLKALGYDVIVDPFDREDLARWEQRHRPQTPPRKWYERP